MAIKGRLYWKQIAKDLREINNKLVDELSAARTARITAEKRTNSLANEKWRKADELSNMRTIGWRIKAIHQCLSGLEYMYAVDVLKEVHERLERDRDKSHVECE